MMKKIALLLCLAAALLLPLTALADAGSLTIVQVYQESDIAARLHVRLEGAVDGENLNLRAEDIAEATIGTGTVPVISVSNAKTEEFGGMRYVFVLDHAMPIGSNRVEELKSGMHEWIDELGKYDYAAVIVSEKEEVRLVTDFTADKNVLHDAVDSYGKANENAGKNMIYSGIKQAIDLVCKTDDSLPSSSCIVVASNGADTYQTLVTAEQLASMLSENSIPLYVAGFAYNAQKESLVGLMNIARNANGWSEDATPVNDLQTLDEALKNLRKRIQGGYDIVLDCSDGFVFNGATLVSIRLKNPDTIIKQTADLYLLKEEKTATPKPAASVTAAPAQSKDNGAAETAEEKFSIEDWLNGETVIAGKALKNSALLPLAIAVVALIVLMLLVLSARKRKNTSQSMEEEEEYAPFPSSEAETHKASGDYPSEAAGMDNAGFSGAAQGGGENKTYRVREGAAEQGGDKTHALRRGAPGVEAPTGTEVVRKDSDAAPSGAASGSSIYDDRTLPNGMMAGGGRQIGSFAPGAAAMGIERMIIDYVADGRTQRFEISNPGEITVGRLTGKNTLVIPDNSVSGQHARITCEGANVYIDNISPVKNGYRNRLCIDRKEVDERAALHNGAHLTIGSVSATISWVESTPRQTPNFSGDETVRAGHLQNKDQDATQRAVAPLLEVVVTLPGQQPAKRMVRMTGPVIIGRGEKDTVRVLDPSVSRGHMKVTIGQAGLVIANGSEDKGSGRNPFYYNNCPVTDAIAYQEGQEILAGRVSVRMRIIR